MNHVSKPPDKELDRAVLAERIQTLVKEMGVQMAKLDDPKPIEPGAIVAIHKRMMELGSAMNWINAILEGLKQMDEANARIIKP